MKDKRWVKAMQEKLKMIKKIYMGDGGKPLKK